MIEWYTIRCGQHSRGAGGPRSGIESSKGVFEGEVESRMKKYVQIVIPPHNKRDHVDRRASAASFYGLGVRDPDQQKDERRSATYPQRSSDIEIH